MPAGGRDLVLVITNEDDDEHVLPVLRELDALGVEHLRFDTGGTSQAVFELRDGRPSVALSRGGPQIGGDRVASILFRHLRRPPVPALDDPQAMQLARSEAEAAQRGALLSLDAQWVNHPYANQLASNKPLQLALAAGEGMALPDTLISSDPQAIRERFRAWDGRMVAKLAGGQLLAPDPRDQYLVPTSVLHEDDLAEDGPLSVCPSIYQRRIEKVADLRITVVGEQVFGARISAPAGDRGTADWRLHGREGSSIAPFEPSEDLGSRARSLVRRMGLVSAGLDFAETPQGEAVFLELNAAGQWAWIEEDAGLPVAAAFAAELAAPCRTHA